MTFRLNFSEEFSVDIVIVYVLDNWRVLSDVGIYLSNQTRLHSTSRHLSVLRAWQLGVWHLIQVGILFFIMAINPWLPWIPCPVWTGICFLEGTAPGAWSWPPHIPERHDLDWIKSFLSTTDSRVLRLWQNCILFFFSLNITLPYASERNVYVVRGHFKSVVLLCSVLICLDYWQ